MNFYFNFFNETKEEYLKIGKEINSITTNYSKFNLKLFEQEIPIDLKNINDVVLIIEKENKGIFYHYKSLSCTIDPYEKAIIFKNVEFSKEENSVYKINLEFKENGITVFNTMDQAKKIFYKRKAEEFDIDVYQSKRINNVFEIQEQNLTELTFEVTVNINEENNTNQYRYWLDYNEGSISNKEFLNLGKNIRVFKEPIIASAFKENETFLFFELRDIFGNINKKKYKILLYGNTFALLEIFSEPININSLNTNIKLFIEYRNAKSITPTITYFDNKIKKRIVSNTTLGENYYINNVLTINLQNLFPGIEEIKTNKFWVSFFINNQEKSISGEVEVTVDTKKPIIKLTNLDEENYRLISDEKEKSAKINGVIFDDSLFFIGSDNKKCKFDNVTNKILIYSLEPLKKIIFSGNRETYLYKYMNYYLAEDLTGEYEIFNENNEKVPQEKYSFIDNRCLETEKKFFIYLDKNKLNNYERNIIENQGGLKIKGPITTEIIGQTFKKLSNFYIIEIKLLKEKTGNFEFKIGIENFEYDFTKYIYDENISCRIDNDKNILLEFEETQFIFLSTKKQNDFLIFNNNEKIKQMKSLILDEISLGIISKKRTDFFTVLEGVTFIDQYLNTLPYEKIHLMPIITKENNEEIIVKNFIMNEISTDKEKSYNFSLEMDLEEGEKTYNIKISDKAGLTENINFILEKNSKPIEFELQVEEMNDSEMYKNEKIYLTNNSEMCFVKIKVLNETRKQRKTEKFLLIKTENTVEKHRIINIENERFVSLYLKNEKEETEYSISYELEKNEMMKIVTKKQEGLYLNVENNFIVGSNYYYLNYKKDDFATLTIEYNNRENFKCEIFDEYIYIQRINNNSFIENLEINLTVNDKNNNYPHKSKTINGKFYNETIITNFKIQEAVEKNGEIDSATFNLFIESFEKENIEYISLYDDTEINVFNRKKIAYYNSKINGYLFEGLTTPISPQSIKLYFHILSKEKLVLEKTIFENNKIYYAKNKNKLLFTVFENNSSIKISINSTEYTETFKKMIIYVNDKEFRIVENISINTTIPHIEEINIYELPEQSDIFVKFIDKKDKAIFSKIFNYSFEIKKSNYVLNHNLRKKIIEEKVANEFYFNTTTNYKMIIEVIDSFGMSKKVELIKGQQTLNLFKSGNIYQVYIYLTSHNSKMQVLSSTIQIYSKLEEIFQLKNKNFEKIKLNNEVIIKNYTLLKNNELNCFLTHYVNGNFLKKYPPTFQNDEIKFNIKKLPGKNKLIFTNNTKELEISNFDYIYKIREEEKIYDLKVEKNIVYKKTEKELLLTEDSNISFRTMGVKKLEIKSETLGRIIEKKAIDKYEQVINHFWIPCEIKFYNENNIIKHLELKIKKLKIESVNFKLFNNIKQIKPFDKIIFKTTKKTKGLKQETYPMKSTIGLFHPLLKFADGYARGIGNTTWFKIDKKSRNEIINKITNNELITEKCKEKITKYLLGR